MRSLRLVISSLVFLILGTLNISHSQWARDTTIINSRIVLSNTSNNRYIFVGTQGSGIYRTELNSANWVRISISFPIDTMHVYCLAVKGDTIFAGTKDHGIFRSLDNGNNWIAAGLQAESVNSLLIKDNNIFAGLGRNKGIYASTNGGVSFSKHALSDKTIGPFAYNNNYIFAAVGSKGIYRSTKDGQKWNPLVLDTGVVNIQSIIIRDKYVYAGSDKKGIYISNDSGITWQHSALYTNSNVFALLTDSFFIFAGTYQKGVCVLNNCGDLLGNEYFDDPHGESVKSLWIQNDHLYAGTWSGVYKRKLSRGPYSK